MSLQNECGMLGAFEVVKDDYHSHIFHWNYQNHANVKPIWSHFDNISIFKGRGWWMDGLNPIMYENRTLDDDYTQTRSVVLEVCKSQAYGRG